MIRKFANVSMLILITFLLMHCVDDPLVDSQTANDDASRRRSRPIANAGTDLIITLPVNSVTLDGSLSKAYYNTGVIEKYEWSKISGPESFTFADASAVKTLVSALTEGLYTFQLKVTDNRNISSSDNVIVTVNKDPNAIVIPPVISSFSPTSGLMGTTVILTGTNFSPTPSNNIVKFNGTQATVKAATATSITATVPSGATTGTITVSINNKIAISTGIFTVPETVNSLSLSQELYFKGNMDNVSISNGSLNGWTDLKNHPYIKGIFFNNLGGSSYAFQEIRKDLVNSSQNVMYAQSIDDDPNVSGTTRAQMTINFQDGVDLPIYHTSHRMYLNPDIAYLNNYSSNINWFTLYEIWNKPNSAWAGSTTGSCRWNLNLFKVSGAGQPLFWHAEAEYMQPSSQKYMWRADNKTTPIPYGKWFTLDLYMKRGEGTAGRFTITITVDGVTTTIFDINNTTIYSGHPELQIKEMQPFKLYTSDAVLDWMRANNKQISVYYNDFNWYKN